MIIKILTIEEINKSLINCIRNDLIINWTEKWANVSDLKNEIHDMIKLYEEDKIKDVDEFAIKLLKKLDEEKKDEKN